SWVKTHRPDRLPVRRGVVALAESHAIGFKALELSANAQMPDDEKEIGRGTWTGTVIFAVLFAVGFFFLLPAFLVKAFGHTSNGVTFGLVEKLARLSTFLGYR